MSREDIGTRLLAFQDIPALLCLAVWARDWGEWSLGTYNFVALNRWDRFRGRLGDGTGLFPETFLKPCGGVTGLGTHISSNQWDYPGSLFHSHNILHCKLIKS